VSHLNLHKTFCIPHGGGGPGVGPIGVKAHLAPFLPGHQMPNKQGAVSRALRQREHPADHLDVHPHDGRRRAQARLAVGDPQRQLHRPPPGRALPGALHRRNGLVAHECILDLRPLKDSSGISVEDVAKRLIDFGFHAPTMSFPVAGTLMVEPTESESKAELDRLRRDDRIREEIRAENGTWTRTTTR
jgi:glycine dehydrogenase